MTRILKHVLPFGVAVALIAGLLVLPSHNVQASGTLNVIVQSVVSDSLVYVESVNFPPNETYTVRMGAAGTQGLGGSLVANFDTGTETASGYHVFEIPTNLKGEASIDLRIETADGLVGLATFTNHSTVVTSAAGVGGVPSVVVTGVLRDSTVTVLLNNLPASTTFTVRIGAAGTQGNGGDVVANFDTSDTGGSVIHTFSIPISLYGSDSLDIRIEALGGFFAYTTFANTSTSNPNVGVGGLSSVIVTKVIGNSQLMATTMNLPANTTITVRIGAAGTQGNGGNVVATFDTGENGGTSSHLFEIPTNLYNSDMLDLRIDAPGGFGAFVEFANVTTP